MSTETVITRGTETVITSGIEKITKVNNGGDARKGIGGGKTTGGCSPVTKVKTGGEVIRSIEKV